MLKHANWIMQRKPYRLDLLHKGAAAGYLPTQTGWMKAWHVAGCKKCQVPHLFALQDITSAIRTFGLKLQPRELIVAQALKGLLDERD